MQLLPSHGATSAALLLVQLFFVLSVWLQASCFVNGATEVSVCASGRCNYTSVEGALYYVTKDNTTINVQPGDYPQFYVSSVKHDITLNLAGDVYIGCPPGQLWISVTNARVVIRGGSLTLSGGGIFMDRSPSFTLNSSLTTIGSVGIALYDTKRFIQYGDLTVATSPEAYGPAMVLAGTEWDQFGDVNVTSDKQSRIGIKTSNGRWTQNGKVDVTVGDQASGIVIRNVSWSQTNTLNVTVGQHSFGVELQKSGNWSQSSNATITANAYSTAVVVVTPPCGGAGVSLVDDYGFSSSSWSVNGTASVSASSRGWGVVNAPGLITVTDKLVISATSDANYAIRSGASNQQCCFCTSSYTFTWSKQGQTDTCVNASATPSPSPSSSPSFSPSPSSSVSPSVPCQSKSASPSPSASPWTSPAPSASATASPLPTPSPSPSPSPGYFQSSTTKDAVMPVLRFNYTAPQLSILPKDGEGKVETRAAVGVALEAVVEVASSTDSTPLASAYCVNGTWNATGAAWFIAGASQSFTYSCLLVSDDDNTARTTTSDAVTMEMQFDLFDNATSLTIHDLVNLTITPSLTKFSLRMRGRWPWRSSESRLELRMAINPTFSRAVLVDTINGSSSAPFLSGQAAEVTAARATTWRLEGQKATGGLKRSVATLVRLVNVVDLDGETRVGDAWISYALKPTAADKSSSGLVVSFGQFNDSLSYDPDIGVLLGRGSKTGDGDNTAVIIGVSVTISLVILVALIVVAVGVVFWFRRRNAVHAYRYDQLL